MSSRFNVSGATIRTDLRILEDAGMLTRTHGGAILRTRASFEVGSDQREEVNLSAKEQIGQLAAGTVEDGDIIVLDTGTTTLQIARHLRQRRNLTVVTNDFMIAKSLEDVRIDPDHPAGRHRQKGYHCAVAISGRSLLDTLNIDKAFMGTNALSLKQERLRGRHHAGRNQARDGGTCQSGDRGVRSPKLSNTSLAQFASLPRSTLSCWIACRKTRRPIRMPASRC